MLTMMTNYTDHNYNSNNDDNISITIMLWINLTLFVAHVVLGGYCSTCIGTFVAKGPIVTKQKIANNDQLGTPLEGGRGYTGAWGAVEGGFGSVERDRHIGTLIQSGQNAVRTLQIDQNRYNTADDPVPHSV